jgi:hypothetical protein
VPKRERANEVQEPLAVDGIFKEFEPSRYLFIPIIPIGGSNAQRINRLDAARVHSTDWGDFCFLSRGRIWAFWSSRDCSAFHLPLLLNKLLTSSLNNGNQEIRKPELYFNNPMHDWKTLTALVNIGRRSSIAEQFITEPPQASALEVCIFYTLVWAETF